MGVLSVLFILFVVVVLTTLRARRGRAATSPSARPIGAAVLAVVVGAGGALVVATGANAAIVPTVLLGTSADYSVLGGQTVTNTGPSILDASLGVSPGSSVTGFPPGIVNAPGTIDIANAAAAQAQSDLTTAYNDAAGRPLNATTAADLGNLTLQGGVYAGPSKGALGLTGTLTLDGANNSDSVFIFQTDSALITASSSTVSLINGAQACNVFWQVGSSATLGTGSVFVGNILALTTVTVTTGVTVEGRALAREAAVTLDTDTFTQPGCEQVPPTTTTTAPASSTTTTPSGPTSTTPSGVATTVVGGGTATTTAGGTGGGSPGGPGTPGLTTSSLPSTGAPVAPLLLAAFALATVGGGLVVVSRSRRRSSR